MVAVGFDPELTYGKVRDATLAIRAGARFVGSNPDTTLPTREGLLAGRRVDPGPAAGLDRGPAEVAGKPERALLDTAAAAIGPGPYLMVGDRADTDLDGAHRLGWSTALVLSGVTSVADLPDLANPPDHVLPDVGGLLDPPGPAVRPATAADEAPAARLLGTGVRPGAAGGAGPVTAGGATGGAGGPTGDTGGPWGHWRAAPCGGRRPRAGRGRRRRPARRDPRRPGRAGGRGGVAGPAGGHPAGRSRLHPGPGGRPGPVAAPAAAEPFYPLGPARPPTRTHHWSVSWSVTATSSAASGSPRWAAAAVVAGRRARRPPSRMIRTTPAANPTTWAR